ncbi:hypothetical protein [Rhodococcus maanshanensis]|uniref:Uncharacterized protein n=1 Tax=Rhodococcus maanshanensis TaxID=183556 RepID=A0A1H7EZX9_9NOCA|nr:hypothetical protein [Rhodococcus maanshanensis]SEK19391.1 hypothetical protein SAMN05444583_1016 [Rhodococcus maanshanensis]
MNEQLAAPSSSPVEIHRWVGVVGAVLAPTTLVTALCYYFGYVYTRKELAFFGVDCDALGLTSTDYVRGSVTVLYAPLLLLLVGWFAAVWIGEYAGRSIRTGQRPHFVRNVARTALAVGAALILTGIAGVWAAGYTAHLTVISWAFSPIALGLGGLLTIAGYWVLVASRAEQTSDKPTPTARVSQVLAISVMVLALFSLMHSFASWLGNSDAQAIANGLWAKESVVTVVRDERLDVPRNLVAETLVEAQPGQPPAFRYQCFRTLVARSDLWVLVPAKWSSTNGYAVIVPAESAVVSQSRSSTYKEIAEANPDPVEVPWECPERAGP